MGCSGQGRWGRLTRAVTAVVVVCALALGGCGGAWDEAGGVDPLAPVEVVETPAGGIERGDYVFLYTVDLSRSRYEVGKVLRATERDGRVMLRLAVGREWVVLSLPTEETVTVQRTVPEHRR